MNQIPNLTTALASEIIAMAWCDKTSFEDVLKHTGIAEKDVILLMRQQLKPSSYKLWRKRVSGRAAKHKKKHVTRQYLDYDQACAAPSHNHAR